MLNTKRVVFVSLPARFSILVQCSTKHSRNNVLYVRTSEIINTNFSSALERSSIIVSQSGSNDFVINFDSAIASSRVIWNPHSFQLLNICHLICIATENKLVPTCGRRAVSCYIIRYFDLSTFSIKSEITNLRNYRQNK